MFTCWIFSYWYFNVQKREEKLEQLQKEVVAVNKDENSFNDSDVLWTLPDQPVPLRDDP